MLLWGPKARGCYCTCVLLVGFFFTDNCLTTVVNKNAVLLMYRILDTAKVNEEYLRLTGGDVKTMPLVPIFLWNRNMTFIYKFGIKKEGFCYLLRKLDWLTVLLQNTARNKTSSPTCSFSLSYSSS